MKKVLIPVIDLVALILVGITFGLASISTGSLNSVVPDAYPVGNLYQIVWNNGARNAFGITTFFIWVVAAFLTLVSLLPIKGRTCITGTNSLLLIAAGVLALNVPGQLYVGKTIHLSSGLIGFAVLLFIAGALTLVIHLIESIKTKKAE